MVKTTCWEGEVQEPFSIDGLYCKFKKTQLWVKLWQKRSSTMVGHYRGLGGGGERGTETKRQGTAGATQ